MAQKGVSIDVERVIEPPEIYMLSRSKASVVDQGSYNQARIDDLQSLTTKLQTQQGVAVTDVLKFFHADGPARQFEAGSKIGGFFSCVECGAQSNRLDDLAYSYRCARVTLAERQQFILTGNAWKKGSMKPLDNLTAAQLQFELQAHRINTPFRASLTVHQC